jgi:hypothetical protein
VRRATRRERRLLLSALRAYRGPRLPDGIVRRRRADPRAFDQDQLAIGVGVEREHTSRPELALEIAMAHLLERRDYYARLERFVERPSREPRMRDPERVKVTQTPIAYWDPTTRKGGRLTVYRSDSSRTGTSYSYRGDGTSGPIRASSDAEAIAYVARNVIPMQQGKLRRVV